jgi:hypothetical protein
MEAHKRKIPTSMVSARVEKRNRLLEERGKRSKRLIFLKNGKQIGVIQRCLKVEP